LNYRYGSAAPFLLLAIFLANKVNEARHTQDLEHARQIRFVKLLSAAIMLVGVKVHRDTILLDENNQSCAQSFSWKLGKVTKLLKSLSSMLNESLNNILRVIEAKRIKKMNSDAST
jgi:hypothetical protein